MLKLEDIVEIAGETVQERSSLSKALRPKKPEADI